MKKYILFLTVILIACSSTTKEQEIADCELLSLNNQVTNRDLYINACMRKKGYKFTSAQGCLDYIKSPHCWE